MKKRVLAVLLGTAMVASMFAGCGGSDKKEETPAATEETKEEAPAEEEEAPAEEAKEEAAPAGDVKVGFAMKTNNGPYFMKLVETVETEAKAKGWDFTVLTANEDITKEAENIETFITQGMDVIFLDSIDPDACIPSIDAAAEAGIPVINLDSGVNGGNYVTTVYSNNKENGRLSGIAYVDWMKANGKEDEEIISILLSGKKGNVAGQERRMGLFAGIVQEEPDVQKKKPGQHLRKSKIRLLPAVKQNTQTLSSKSLDRAGATGQKMMVWWQQKTLSQLTRTLPHFLVKMTRCYSVV